MLRWLGLIILAAIAGCAHAPRADRAVIKSEGLSVFVLPTDHAQRARNLLDVLLLPAEIIRRAVKIALPSFSSEELAPGDRYVGVMYGQMAFSIYKLKVEAGHTYVVRHVGEASGLSVASIVDASDFEAIEIVDSKSGHEVGEVLRSVGEPIPQGEPLALPGFFTWPYPTGKRQMTMFRDTRVRGVKWSGASDGESYSVTIQAEEASETASPDQFVSFVKAERERVLARANIKDQSAEAVAGREDYCARYSDVLMGHIPGSIPPGIVNNLAVAGVIVAADVLLSTRVRTETVGYACRIPTNKKFLVDIRYTHVSIGDHPDQALAVDGQKFFNDLKF